jgi:hypothetical protein
MSRSLTLDRDGYRSSFGRAIRTLSGSQINTATDSPGISRPASIPPAYLIGGSIIRNQPENMANDSETFIPPSRLEEFDGSKAQQGSQPQSPILPTRTIRFGDEVANRNMGAAPEQAVPPKLGDKTVVHTSV